MSDYAARSVLSRINLREMAVAAHYEGLASDLQLLAMANHEQAEAEFMTRRTELVAAYGMSPYFRISYATDMVSLREGCTRIQEFCAELR